MTTSALNIDLSGRTSAVDSGVFTPTTVRSLLGDLDRLLDTSDDDKDKAEPSTCDQHDDKRENKRDDKRQPLVFFSAVSPFIVSVL